MTADSQITDNDGNLVSVPRAAGLAADLAAVTAAAAAAAAASGFVGFASGLDVAAAANLADTSVVPLTVANESVDTNGFHSTSVNSERVTVPAGKDGLYVLRAMLDFGTNATGTYRRCYLFANNSSVGIVASKIPSASSNILLVDLAIRLAAGDFIDLRGRQDSGGALDCYVQSFVFQRIAD